jgi:hypothetical protein
VRTFFLTLAVLFAVIATGLLFGWGFWFFDDPAWREDALGWVPASIGCFAFACHTLPAKFDERYHR